MRCRRGRTWCSTVLGETGGDGGRAGGRLVPHGRRRERRRAGRPSDDLGPEEGRHHHRRRERVVDRGGGHDLRPPRGGRGRGHRRAGHQVGRDGQGADRPGRGSGGDRGGDHRLLQGAHGRVQGADERGVPGRHSAHGHREDPDVSSCGSPTGPDTTGASADGPVRRAPVTPTTRTRRVPCGRVWIFGISSSTAHAAAYVHGGNRCLPRPAGGPVCAARSVPPSPGR